MTSESDFQTGFDDRPAEGLAVPPWEDRDRYGFINGLYQTVRDVLLLPGRFFARMPTGVGLLQPLFFAIVLGATGAFFDWMWTLVVAPFELMVATDAMEAMKPPVTFGALFILSPLLVTAFLFAIAALTHACLTLVSGNRLGFEATFRVVAYSQAVSILSLLPLCGNVIGSLWGLAIMVIGLYRIHDTDPWRAVVAVLAPTIFCLMSCGGVALVGSGLGVLR